MKKVFLVLLFLLMASVLLAEAFSSSGAKKAYIPDRMVIGLGNDKYSYGISRNDDDQFSYSLFAKLEAPRWYVAFEGKGITNRGWREGWDVNDEAKPYTSSVYRGRYDSLETTIGYKWKAIEEDYYLHLYPEVGFAVVGDCGLEFGQNSLHKLTGIHPVELPKEMEGERKWLPMVDGRANFGYKLHRYLRTNLIAEVELSSRNILGFQSENQILGRLAFSTETHDLFGFHIGYLQASAFGENTNATQELYLDYLTGWRFGFFLTSDTLSINYTGTPGTGYGYGTIGVNLLGFLNPRVWDGSDISLTISRTGIYGRTFNRAVAEMTLRDHWSIVLSDFYKAGNAVDEEGEKHADLTKETRVKRAYTTAVLGLRYHFPSLLQDFVTPYASLGAGFQRYWIYRLNNQLADAFLSSLYPSGTIPLGKEYHPLINLEVGADLLPGDLLVIQNSNFQLQVFGGLHMVFGDSAVLSRYQNANSLASLSGEVEDKGWRSHFVPYFGLGVKCGFSL